MERKGKNAGYKSHACEIAPYYQSTGQSTNEYPAKGRREEKKRKP